MRVSSPNSVDNLDWDKSGTRLTSHPNQHHSHLPNKVSTRGTFASTLPPAYQSNGRALQTRTIITTPLKTPEYMQDTRFD